MHALPHGRRAGVVGRLKGEGCGRVGEVEGGAARTRDTHLSQNATPPHTCRIKDRSLIRKTMSDNEADALYDNLMDEEEEDLLEEEAAQEEEEEQEGLPDRDEKEPIAILPHDAADSTKANKVKITTRFLTKYERARILGTRALQISMNAPIMVKPGTETDPLKIAMMELRARKIPIIIRRYLPDGSHEDWRIEELEIPGLEM